MNVAAQRHPIVLAALLLGFSPAPTSAQAHWDLQRVQTAGVFGSSVEFGSITAVALGRKGVYVGDGLNLRIVILDSALNRIGTVGRSGSGPAEFRSISEIAVRGDTIYAYDVGLRRLNAITDAGEPLWTHALVPTMAGENVAPHPSRVLADGTILVRGRAGPGTPAHGLHRFDRESGERVRIATMDHNRDAPIGRADYEGMTTTVRRPIYAADRSAAAPGGAFVAVLIQSDPAEGGEGRAVISVLSPMGDTLWAHALRTAKVPIDPNHIARVVDEGARKFAESTARDFGIARGVSSQAYKEALAIPPYQVAFDRVVAGGEGAVFLRRGGYGLDEVEWVRVTAAGLDAVFTLPASHEVVAAHGRRIYTTSPGSLDEPTITAWAAEPVAPGRR